MSETENAYQSAVFARLTLGEVKAKLQVFINTEEGVQTQTELRNVWSYITRRQQALLKISNKLANEVVE